MSLARKTVENPHLVWALALTAAIFGAVSYLRLPMQLFPDTAPPLVNVVTAWPGASAEDVAEDLGRELEEEFASLEGVVRVESSSRDNLSVVTAEFRYDRPVELAAVDVQNAIARIRGRLPADIEEPQVLRFSTSDRPVITLGVRPKHAAAGGLVTARRLAEDVIAPRFQRVPGVAAVDVFGGEVRSVLVEVDPRKLEAYRLPLGRVIAALRAHNVARPAGDIRTGDRRTMFRLEARADDVEALGRVPVVAPDGSRLRLRDVARLREGALEDDARFAIDGRRAIALQVFKTTEANTVEVVRAVEAAAAAIEASYPFLEIEVGEESATFTERSIDNLLANVWQALLLAGAVIFLFIGRWGASLVAFVSMPLSYGMTFALMKVTGTELNMVTLTAVILAVGMVVDASVVVLENISRHRDQEGRSAKEAAIAGADEVRLAVLAGAGTTLIVLVPLLFLSGFIGKTFGPLARTLLFAFTSSIAVALVLVPVLALSTGGRTRLDRVGLAIARPFQWTMDRVRDVYLKLLARSLRLRAVTVVVTLGLFAAGVALLRGQGSEVLPKMDGGSFFVSLETPAGSTLEETERVVRDIEAILKAEPEVVTIQSQVGFEPGMRSFSGTGAQGPTQGFITVTLTPRTERSETIWEIEDRVRRALARVPGIRTVTVRESGNTAKATTSAPIIVRVSGADPLVLDRLGDEVLARVARVPSVVEPVRNWRIDQERVLVDVDPLRAGRLGLSPAEVAAQMQMAATGVPAGWFHGGEGTPIPIRVRYAREAADTPDDLMGVPLIVPDGGAPAVPLRGVATFADDRGRAVVTREDLAPTLEVSAFTHGRPLSEIIADVEESLADLTVPAGYEVVLTGEKRDLAEAKGELGGALAVSVVAVYLLLVAQLRSFVHPFTILLTVPLSLVGVGLALFLAGKPVSMPVMVGLVLLVGTVVNNAIILLDFIRQRRDGGASRRDAVLASVRTRFRPIMMTSLSTIVGMIPLAAEWALGAERFSPLATAVIGGMTAATFLTLIVIPVLYDLFDDIGGLMGSGRSRRRRRASPRGAVSGTAALVLLAITPWPRPAAAETVRLDLEAAFERARAHSPTLAARRELTAAAEARAAGARARLLPRLDARARYSRLSEVEPTKLELPLPQQPGASSGFALGDPITDIYSLRVSLTQPLFTGFALTEGRRAAEAGVELARREHARTVEDLRLQVEEAWLGLYRARRMRAVADASLEVLRAHLSRVRELAGAGRATDADVAQTEARLAEAEVAAAEAEGQARVAELRLKVLTGLPEDAEIELAPPPEARGAPTSADPVDRALAGRAELRVARTRARAAGIEAEIARSALYPQLFLDAGWTLANPPDRAFPPREEFEPSWDVSLIAT